MPLSGPRRGYDKIIFAFLGKSIIIYCIYIRLVVFEVQLTSGSELKRQMNTRIKKTEYYTLDNLQDHLSIKYRDIYKLSYHVTKPPLLDIPSYSGSKHPSRD